MMLFKGKYLSDEEIWSRIGEKTDERDRISQALAEAGAEADPQAIASLSRKLAELNRICFPVDRLNVLLKDLQELAELLEGKTPEEEPDLLKLYAEYSSNCSEMAGEVYRLLLESGSINEEKEDEKDLQILKFIGYAGPEYAWRLGINTGMDVSEARERLERLLGKGLLEKVQGTMLEGYHREKDWVKHMNHTYYRLSREGEHFLRNLRKENL